jgi:hypothetical protein
LRFPSLATIISQLLFQQNRERERERKKDLK